MKIERKTISSFWKVSMVVAITIAFILPGSAVFTNEYGVISPVDTLTIEWDVTLNFNEYGGKLDYAVFGEAPDANDGPPADSYDAPKPPAPQPPYVRAWFDDNLTMPYNKLWEDFRQYPDTNKTWDLYVKWECYNANLTNITISWDVGGFIGCEYNSVVLWRYDPFGMKWDLVADLLASNNYVYTPLWFNEQWLMDSFQIIAGIEDEDTTPPVTTCALEGEKDGDIYVGPVTVTLNATDDMSGVNYTMYSVDRGEWFQYVDPFIVSDYGESIVWFYSVDNAGNVETEKNCTFTIITPDITPPVTTCTLDGELVGGVYISNVTVTLTATDDMSGVDYTMYKLDDGVYNVYTGPFVVSGDNSYTVHYYSVDLAGNVEAEKSKMFIIDSSSCPIEFEVSGDLGINVVIINTGSEDLYYLEWSISLDKGLVLSDREKTGVIKVLPAGEETEVRFLPFGIGFPEITITAGCAELEIRDYLLIFYFLIEI